MASSGVTIERIVVPVDGSACAMRALRYACGLSALAGGAAVDACYDIDYLSLPGRLEQSANAAPDALIEEGERILRKSRTIARKYGVELHGSLIRGNVAAAIVRFARKRRADLIVMGTHGRKGIQRVLLGSVAEGVLRRSDVPVLLVREGAVLKGRA